MNFEEWSGVVWLSAGIPKRESQEKRNEQLNMRVYTLIKIINYIVRTTSIFTFLSRPLTLLIFSPKGSLKIRYTVIKYTQVYLVHKAS